MVGVGTLACLRECGEASSIQLHIHALLYMYRLNDSDCKGPIDNEDARTRHFSKNRSRLGKLGLLASSLLLHLAAQRVNILGSLFLDQYEIDGVPAR